MMLIDFIYSAAQLQSADPTAAPSPELLKAIADLVNAVAGHPPARSWASPEGVKAAADLIFALAWPVVAGIIIYLFGPQLMKILSRTNKVSIGGVELQIEKELSESAEQATSKLSPGPSKDEFSRATKVADLAKQDVALIRQQVDRLAFEYNNLRGLLPSGDKRTRLMEEVVSKMRTIGRAAFGIRYELMASPSPGHRLQAVACLQVLPDYELLDWLARRVREDSRFIGYHALIALIAAAGRTDARAHLNEIETAAIESGRELPEGSDRWNAWRRLMEGIASLKE